jgi:heme o synthase
MIQGMTRFPVISRVIAWSQLVKMPVCLLVAFSAVFGSVLAGRVDGAGVLLISLGMFCLACGGAAMNSLQEIGLDASMARTKDRPLPNGRIGAGQAASLTVLLISAGLLILYQASHLKLTVVLGMAAVVLYNLVYTNLKTRTVAAIIPGAVSGALPPYIGWTAAGGDPLAVTAVFLGALFILWQIPHTLLILLRHKGDYLSNGIPSLIKLFPEVTLKRLSIVWVAAFCIVLLLFTGIIAGLALGVKILIWISASLLFIAFCVQLSCQNRTGYYLLFIQLNCYLFFIMILLVGQRLYFG